MKTQRKWLAIGLPLAAGIALVAGAVAGEKDQSSGFFDKMKQWQAEMSETFRKAFDGAAKGTSPAASASVDLREQSDSYLVRLSLPGRAIDKVDVELDGNLLRIDAPAEGQASSYRQSITLPGAADGTAPLVPDMPPIDPQTTARTSHRPKGNDVERPVEKPHW